MTCREFWNAMPELGSDSDQHEHAKSCPSCAAIFDRQAKLAAGLKQLARDRREVEAPARLEGRLLKAFRAQTGQGAPAPMLARREWLAWVPAAAAMIALAVLLVRGVQPVSQRTGDFENAQNALESPDDSSVIDSDFIPAPFAAASSPAEDADWVQVAVPRSALVALGLPITMDGGTGPVEAVVALGADGVVQGVRLLQ